MNVNYAVFLNDKLVSRHARLRDAANACKPGCHLRVSTPLGWEVVVKDYGTHFLRFDGDIRMGPALEQTEAYSLFQNCPYGRVIVYAMSMDDAIAAADVRVAVEQEKLRSREDVGREAGMLPFTVNEQNFLAQVMQEISTLAYKARSSQLPSDEELAKVGDAIAWAAVRFSSVNIGDLYDKFHRQGKNQ